MLGHICHSHAKNPMVDTFRSPLDMDKRDFVCMHKGVLHGVVRKGAFEEIIAKLKLSTFARKHV